MSIEGALAPAHRARTLSRPLERRLRLLKSVLPSLESAAGNMYYAPRRKRFGQDKAKQFWAKFLAPCLRMSPNGWNFHNLNDQHDELVSRLLERLEKTVSIEKSAIAEEFTSSTFPQLEMLRIWTRETPGDSEDTEDTEDLFAGHWNILVPTDQLICKDLIALLDEFADALEGFSKPPPSEEVAPVVSRPRLSIAPLLLKLFSTISAYCRCSCSHQAMLLLCTRRSLPQDIDFHSFTMLLSRKHGRGSPWQETKVAIREQITRPKPRFMFSEPSRLPGRGQSPTDSSPEHVKDLCITMLSLTASRLHLNIEGQSLFKLPETDPGISELKNVESVSLAEGLLNNDTELDIDSKTCLAVVLSHSLLDFCWEPWFPNGWSRSSIKLLQNSERLSLRPTLATSLRSRSEDPSLPTIPNDLKLLFHGILLMEIFKQAEISLAMNHRDMINDIEHFRMIARKEFDQINWAVHEGFRQSVTACLDGIPENRLDPSENAEESFATNFCKAIISPLERDFTSLWGKKDPDQVLSGISLPTIKLRSIPPRKPPPRPKPDHLKMKFSNPFMCSRLNHPSVPSWSTSYVRGSTSGPLPFKFFDTDDRPEETQTKRAKEWFQRYDRAFQAQQKALPIKGKGITVAILDTGINLQNKWISAKIGRIKCWPSRASCNDTDGHGTHVAYLLMRLVPSANIRIAKISDSQLLNDDDIIQRIAKAIEHFSSKSGDPVDIINLSFGFPEYNDRLQPIRKALLQAQQNNVLLFAAAGNAAGNEGVYWPASMEVVTRVNAVDGDGNVAGISTTGGELRPIFTLGEGVPSCQLNSSSNEVIYRSGTSFATPIAVATAAIVLGYMNDFNEAVVPEDVESLKSRLRTKSGMEGVLRETCVLQGPMKRTDIAYIAPFFFLNIEASSLVGIITNALRTCAG